MDLITAKIAAKLVKSDMGNIDEKIVEAKQVLEQMPENYMDLQDSVDDIRDRIVNVVTVRNEEDAEDIVRIPTWEQFEALRGQSTAGAATGPWRFIAKYTPGVSVNAFVCKKDTDGNALELNEVFIVLGGKNSTFNMPESVAFQSSASAVNIYINDKLVCQSGSGSTAARHMFAGYNKNTNIGFASSSSSATLGYYSSANIGFKDIDDAIHSIEARCSSSTSKFGSSVCMFVWGR